jgi:low affinity Fe/Cu permease
MLGLLLLDRWDNVGSFLMGSLLVIAFLALLFIWSISRLLKFDAQAKKEGMMGVAVLLIVTVLVAVNILY